MQDEVEDVDRAYQLPLGQHPQLFPEVGFGHEGREPQGQGGDDEKGEGQAVDPGEHRVVPIMRG